MVCGSENAFSKESAHLEQWRVMTIPKRSITNIADADDITTRVSTKDELHKAGEALEARNMIQALVVIEL